MKRHIFIATAFVGIALLGTTAAYAQATDNDSIVVTANNVGIFIFEINEDSFDFGDVDSSGEALPGTNPAVTPNGRLGTDDGGSYTGTSAATWFCRSAPSRTVTIFNDPAGTFAGPAGSDPSRLETQMQISSNPLGGGASEGFKNFTTTGSPAGDLITGMNTGNGGNQATGTIDFRLTILDEDPTGLYTWTVVLTASGV